MKSEKVLSTRQQVKKDGWKDLDLSLKRSQSAYSSTKLLDIVPRM